MEKRVSLKEFFNEQYFYFLSFLPEEDLDTMADLNAEWEGRVTSYEIWGHMMKAVKDS